MTRSTNNAFTSSFCTLTGDAKTTSSLKATPRETQLYAVSKAQREKIVMQDAPNGIAIPSSAASDQRQDQALPDMTVQKVSIPEKQNPRLVDAKSGVLTKKISEVFNGW